MVVYWGRWVCNGWTHVTRKPTDKLIKVFYSNEQMFGLSRARAICPQIARAHVGAFTLYCTRCYLPHRLMLSSGLCVQRKVRKQREEFQLASGFHRSPLNECQCSLRFICARTGLPRPQQFLAVRSEVSFRTTGARSLSLPDRTPVSMEDTYWSNHGEIRLHTDYGCRR